MQSWWRSPTQPYGDDRLIGSWFDPLVLRMRAMREYASCYLQLDDGSCRSSAGPRVTTSTLEKPFQRDSDDTSCDLMTSVKAGTRHTK